MLKRPHLKGDDEDIMFPARTFFSDIKSELVPAKQDFDFLPW